MSRKAHIAWTSLEAAGRQVLLLASSVILARNISPSDFGLFALASLPIGIAAVLADFGIGSSLVRLDRVDEAHRRTAFTLQLGLGLFLVILMVPVSLALGAYFVDARIGFLTFALSVPMLISSLSSAHTALLSREQKFTLLAKIYLSATVISSLVTVTVSFWLHSPWTLALQPAVYSLCVALLSTMNRSWKPRIGLDRVAAKEMLAFGAPTVGVGLLSDVQPRILTLAIGINHSPDAVAQFQRAYTSHLIPMQSLASIFNRLSFPILASQQSDMRLFEKTLRALTSSGVAISAPIMCALALNSSTILVYVFGEAWRPAGPAFAALCVSGAIYPLQAISHKAVLALGRSGSLFVLHLSRLFILVPMVVLAAPHGILVVALFYTIYSFICHFFNMILLARVSVYSFLKQALDLLPVAASTAAMIAFAKLSSFAGFGVGLRYALVSTAGAFFVYLVTLATIVVLTRHPLRAELQLLLSTVSGGRGKR